MIQRSIQSISGFLLRNESRFGLPFSSVIIATIMFGLAMLYVQPVLTVAFHGIQFSALSEDPFDLSTANALRYRILGPLLGYLLFLRGEYFFILPLLATWAFPGIVYFCYRKKNLDAIDAFFLTCFVSFSCILLLPIVAPAYTDIFTWIFIFLAFHFIEKIPFSALFASLALLNHESSFVMVPALVVFSYYKNKDALPKILIFFLLACAPHLLYRSYVHFNSETTYDLSFYLSKSNVIFTMTKLVLFGPAAFFYAFKLWWIFPVYMVALTGYQKNYFQFIIQFLILGAALSLVIIGYDYTRMLVIAFPAVLLSYEWLMKKYDIEKFRKFTFIMILMNFLILQYHFNYDGAQPMFPWVLNKISEMFGIPLV